MDTLTSTRSVLSKTLSELSPSAVLAGTFILFLGPFLMVELFPSQMDRVMGISSYLVFHNIAEFFSIMVSLSVFSVGWYTYDQSKDRHALFLGTAFLAVGLLDFMHTMSNVAMPAFLTSNSTNKSTQFWIAARLFDASAFMVSASIYPGSQSWWLSKKTLLISGLVITGLVFSGVVFFPSYLPATAIPGVGLTPLKRYLEFLVILLLIVAAVAYWKRMAKTGDRNIIYYLAAFIICIFSEAVFASYKTGFDTYNVLGHTYKVAAFYLIYKGLFTASIKRPYDQLSQANEKLRIETVSRHELQKEVEERKRVEQALREGEAKYRGLFENMINGFAFHKIVVDKQGKPIDYVFLEVNDAFEKLTGLKRMNIINRPVTDVIPGIKDDIADWIGTYGMVALTGQEARFEQHSVALGRWYSVLAYCPVKGYFATVFEDITERKQAEADVVRLSEDMAARNIELESLNKELESFIYSVSHDLRAPVRTMAGFADILIEDYSDKLGDQGKNCLSRIQAGSAKMARLIEDLLNLSRITRQEMDRIETDLSSKASIAIAELREACADRKIDVQIQPGIKASADPRLMGIVLSNLLGNAWKFTSKTENTRIEFGAINCGLRNADCGMPNEKSEIIYYVRDNGAGFDPQYADKMFWPFHRLHTEQEFEGTGIGLTIVERIIRRHGGRVWAEGEPGKGATFFFTLGV